MDKPYPPSWYANYVLAVLLLAYIFSFIDRNVLALLVGPIRADFAVSDFQFSILHGWAFTLFYIGLGLPIGWLADRYSRRRIIIAGVFFWSAMTSLCGLARGYWTLFLARVGVGVGESALSPPAYSLMSDYFRPERLRWATSIFTMGITLGSGLSYMVGGWLYDHFVEMDFSFAPSLGEFSAWQLTFLAVGLPGFLIVGLLMLVREPTRRRLPAESGDAVPLSEVVHFLRQHRRVYMSLMMGVSMMSIIGYGTLTWFPELLFRNYAMSRSEAGGALGLIFMIAGTAGTLSGAAFATLLQRMGYNDANMRLIMLAALIILVPGVAMPLMPNETLALWLAVPVIFFHYTHFGVAVAALQLITPNRMRAQVSALLLLLTNLLGLALGGSVVAFFTDFIFGEDQALRYSLAAVAALVYPATALFIGMGLQPYREALAQAAHAAPAD